MLRRSFRFGLRVGLLVGITIAVVKALRGRRDARELASPPGGRWAPMPPPVAAQTQPAWVAPEGGSCPATHPIKAKLASGLFHLPGMLAYERTKADRCYATEQAAESDGLTRAKR